MAPPRAAVSGQGEPCSQMVERSIVGVHQSTQWERGMKKSASCRKFPDNNQVGGGRKYETLYIFRDAGIMIATHMGHRVVAGNFGHTGRRYSVYH